MISIKYDKVKDPELRGFAQLRKSREKRSIIVELASPPLKVLPRRTSRETKSLPKYRSSRFSKRKSRKDLRDIEGHKKEMDMLGKELSKLGISTKDLTRIDSAQAFIVSTDSEQLRNILRNKLAGAVRPNRVHRLYKD